MNRYPYIAAAAGLLCALSAQGAAPSAGLLGDVVPASAATRTVQIKPGTTSVTVVHGETVRFVDAGRQFAFDFDGARHSAAFDLRLVAPPGLLDHAVTAYVNVNPDDVGGPAGM